MYRCNRSKSGANPCVIGWNLSLWMLLIGVQAVGLPAHGEAAVQGGRDPGPGEAEVRIEFKPPNTDEARINFLESVGLDQIAAQQLVEFK